jgi:anti-sigma regulatory factor (Ser/Thr protein kinase)
LGTPPAGKNNNVVYVDPCAPRTLVLPPEPSAPAIARRYLASHCHAERDIAAGDALVDVVLLLTSEIVTNAVVHAGTEATLQVQGIPDGIRVEVTDGSPELPARRHGQPDGVGGWGVLLLERLATAWGAERGDGGKTVWFEVRRPH